jgi:hypothetical protein
MTVARVIAATAMFAGLGVGTASTAWADTTMSGHYIKTSTNSEGKVTTADWYFTPCGDGCASVSFGPGRGQGQAQLVNGQWTLDLQNDTAHCPDGSSLPGAMNDHFTWDPNTLAGTSVATYNVPACGHPAGFQYTNNVQLRQAP